MINKENQTINIKSIQPVINSEIAYLVSELVVPSQILANQIIVVKGQIELNTYGLNKEQILSKLPYTEKDSI
ncbi:MAG: hypothetical protein RSF87_11010 [Cellulosilyticaceae bacterium]